MKQSNTMERLMLLMKERNLRQVDIVNLVEPVAKQYNSKFNKSDISQYLSGKTEPNQNKLFILGKALNVSPAWLMGYDLDEERKNNNEFTKRDERDIVKKLNSILNEMNSSDALMFDGEEIEMDEESKELIAASIENSLRIAKRLAKEKYTPKKYKK